MSTEQNGPRRRTIPVRIAVAVSQTGAWYAIGSNEMDDATACEEAMGQVDEGRCFIVTADVPTPVEEIGGRVEDNWA
jgi:hypothetical protein